MLKTSVKWHTVSYHTGQQINEMFCRQVLSIFLKFLKVFVCLVFTLCEIRTWKLGDFKRIMECTVRCDGFSLKKRTFLQAGTVSLGYTQPYKCATDELKENDL